MIENIEQAKEILKDIVDFYKLNDENNYDYSDEVLISMRTVLEEIERLKERLDISQTAYLAVNEKNDKAIEYIEKHEEKQYGFNYEYELNIYEIEDLKNILKDEKKTI